MRCEQPGFRLARLYVGARGSWMMVAMRLVADGGCIKMPGGIEDGVQAKGIICMYSVQWPESVCTAARPRG